MSDGSPSGGHLNSLLSARVCSLIQLICMVLCFFIGLRFATSGLLSGGVLHFFPIRAVERFDPRAGFRFLKLNLFSERVSHNLLFS